MSVRGQQPRHSTLPPEAEPTARQALAEARLRGLAAAEEYRLIADRLYRAGFRDLPSGGLVHWIEETVAADYERLLALRALGERLHTAVAAGDLARAAWLLACEMDPGARLRLLDGVRRLTEIDHETG
jgi:hypothetical protein